MSERITGDECNEGLQWAVTIQDIVVSGQVLPLLSPSSLALAFLKKSAFSLYPKLFLPLDPSAITSILRGFCSSVGDRC